MHELHVTILRPHASIPQCSVAVTQLLLQLLLVTYPEGMEAGVELGGWLGDWDFNGN